MNAVFAGNSTDIPSAASIHGALEAFNEQVSLSGFDAKPIPTKIKKDEVSINQEVALAVDSIREYANSVVSVAAAKAALEKILVAHAPVNVQRLKL